MASSGPAGRPGAWAGYGRRK